MSSLEKILIERWYNIILMLGIGLIGSSFAFEISFLNKKHLIGLAVGLILIGISFNIARKYISTPFKGGFFQSESIIHTLLTKLILIVGIFIAIFFLTLLIISLI